MVVMAARGEVDQGARDQAKHADEVHRGKTAPGFLAGGLRLALLVFGGFGHGNPGAIGADRAGFCTRAIAPDVCDELANRLAAEACRVERLVKKAPEDHLQRKDAFAAVL